MVEPKCYCGANPLPSGARMGTAKECAEKKQIRQYGLIKVEKSALVSNKKGLSLEKERVKLQTINTKMEARMLKYKHEKNEKKKEKIKESLKKMADKYKLQREKVRKLVAENNN